MNNILGIMGQFQNFMQNPVSFLMQNNINIPQGIGNDPNAIIQQMLNTGRINQQQYNQAQNLARQMRNNPTFRNYFR